MEVRAPSEMIIFSIAIIVRLLGQQDASGYETI
jgi:hypothetical protein